MEHTLCHRVLQPLVSVDVETFMGPMSAQVLAHGDCFVARGHSALWFLHDLSHTKVLTLGGFVGSMVLPSSCSTDLYFN